MFPIEPDKPPSLDQLFMSLVETARRNEVEVGLIRLFTVLAAEAADPHHPAHAFFVDRHDRFKTYIGGTIRGAQEAGTISVTYDP